MDELLRAPRSLDKPKTDYTIFERDQVLTEQQLNSISDYFEDQGRLTRVALLGVGILGGLQVGIDDGKVAVGKGVGVTTDGDLLMLAAPTVYDQVRAYVEKAPYPPFQSGAAGKAIELWELVEQSGDGNPEPPMSALPGKLADYAVLMYMESCKHDRDQCSANDCDNLGISATNAARLLLVPRADADRLVSGLPRADGSRLLPILASAADVALELPWIDMQRPLPSSAVANAKALEELYWTACNDAQARLLENLQALGKLMPELLTECFGMDPVGRWQGRLRDIKAKFAPADTPVTRLGVPIVFRKRDEGIQYYYDFLKDLTETWNELRERLLADDSLLCPDFGAFPKHLLLGALSAPKALRTGLYPSPLTGGDRAARRHAIFLLKRLDAMLNSASFPPAGTMDIRITPSRGEGCSLEERAIPFYYAHLPEYPIQTFWNFRLSNRRAASRNLGYRWDEYNGNPNPPDPFARQLGRHDFFRIEGHLGQKVDAAATTLRRQLAKCNLPIAVYSVLLHNARDKIVIRPPHYGDLHRFHQLLRQEVATQLVFSKAFNDKLAKKLPEEKAAQLETHQTNLIAAVNNAVPVLTTTRYSSYRQTLSKEGKDWKTDLKSVVQTAGAVKLGLGERLHTDIVSPLDTVISNNHGIRLGWLDQIIEHRDERADQKLLFSGFIEQHPGIEHLGGAPRGGTFILVYDDDGIVVADFALPYYLADSGEEEDDEPELSLPDDDIPTIIDKGFKVLDPLDERIEKGVKVLEEKVALKWKDIQSDNLTFFENSLGALTNVLGKTAVSPTAGASKAPKSGDDYLDLMVDDLQNKRTQVDRVRGLLATKGSDDPNKAKLEAQLANYEKELASTVTQATQHLVDTTSETKVLPANDVISAITGAAGAVRDSTTLKSMETTLGSMHDSPNAGIVQKNLVSGVMAAAGMSRR